MTDTKTLTFTRTINARPAHVFAALTKAEHRRLWGAPDADSVVVIEGQPEPAPGGRELSRVGPAENPYVDVATDWVILDSDSRVVYAETLSAEGEAFGVSLAAFDLAETGAGTELSLAVQCVSFAGPEALGEIESGWANAITNLALHAEASHVAA